MEFWDIYDINKRPTGRTMKRNDWCLKDGEYHLTVLGVVARPDGTFLITKRVMTKAWAPGWWEVSGGAAQAGESSYNAVLREVKEETGLDVSSAQGGYLFTYKRENPGERKQTTTCSPHWSRSKPLPQKENSFTTTASRPLFKGYKQWPCALRLQILEINNVKIM